MMLIPHLLSPYLLLYDRQPLRSSSPSFGPGRAEGDRTHAGEAMVPETEVSVKVYDDQSKESGLANHSRSQLGPIPSHDHDTSIDPA
jgi:hypothetical protein